MYQQECALQAGGSLEQAKAAYTEAHSLDHDHDDDAEVEHHLAAFDVPDRNTWHFFVY
jgi:hypothetical protein